MHLEPTADSVALALNEFKKSLDSLYWERVKILDQNGDLFPKRNAQFDLQQRMTDLVGSGRYTTPQARALSAAFQCWKPSNMEDEADG